MKDIHVGSKRMARNDHKIAKCKGCDIYIWTDYKYHTGYGVSSPGIHNYKDFCRKINIPKGNYWILRIGVKWGGVKKC